MPEQDPFCIKIHFVDFYAKRLFHKCLIRLCFSGTALNSFTTSSKLDGAFCIGLINGSISFSDGQAALLKGRTHTISIELNKDVPDDVKNGAGVFDVYRVNIGDTQFLDGGVEVTIFVKTQSRVREIYVISEEGTVSKIVSDKSYDSGVATYSFHLNSSGYVSAMAESRELPYEKETLIAMVSVGSILGLVYVIRIWRKGL